jgi:hypothetical protein
MNLAYCVTRGRFRDLLDLDPEPSEWWAAAAVLVWVLWSHYDPLGLDARANWRILIAIMDADGWEMTGAVLSAAQFACLLFGKRFCRFYSCTLGVFWWTFLFFALVQVEKGAPSLSLYLIIAGMNFYSMVWLGPPPAVERALRRTFKRR